MLSRIVEYVAAEHSTVRTDSLLAISTIILHLQRVFLAHFFGTFHPVDLFKHLRSLTIRLRSRDHR